MYPKTLKLFNDIISISALTDYEAHTVDGKLQAQVASFDNTTLVEVSIDKIPDELHLYTNCFLINKYIDFFDKPFEIKTNDKTILFFNDDLEAVIPLVEKENCVKSTKKLKKEFTYAEAFVLNLPIADLKFALKVSAKLEEYIIKFELDEYLTITVGNVKRKMKDIVGKPGVWHFKYDVIERVLKYSPDKVTLHLPYNQEDVPVTAEFVSGALTLKAFIMRITP